MKDNCNRCNAEASVHRYDEYLCFGCFIDAMAEKHSLRW